MQKKNTGIFLAGLLIAGAAVTAQIAFGGDDRRPANDLRKRGLNVSFQRVSTLANYRNNNAANIDETTVSEIIAATRDGKTLVYTDSPGKQIGFVDITDPANPVPDGIVTLDGEPTSVDVLANKYALVAVNTSANFVNTSGKLVIVDIATRTIVGSVDLGGQPDSVKISPDGKYVAIAIENERDEGVEVDGVEGGLPQSPAGYLAIVDIIGVNPTNWVRRDVSLTGLASYGGNDPEPEFVDVNEDNEAVVTLQENNHIAIVNLVTGAVIEHFNANTVTLSGIDKTEDGIISLTETLTNVPRNRTPLLGCATASRARILSLRRTKVICSVAAADSRCSTVRVMCCSTEALRWKKSRCSTATTQKTGLKIKAASRKRLNTAVSEATITCLLAPSAAASSRYTRSTAPDRSSSNCCPVRWARKDWLPFLRAI